MIIDKVSRPLLFSLLQVCYFAAEAVDYICDQNDSTQSWHKINLQKKIWCLKSICCAQTEFTPSFKVGWVFKFLLMDLSLSGVCRNSFVRKSEEKKIHPWATNPLGVILLIARERKKKVTGLENNKILSVFGSDSGKLQTDAVVCFLLMAVQSRMYDVYKVYNFRCGKYIL